MKQVKLILIILCSFFAALDAFGKEREILEKDFEISPQGVRVERGTGPAEFHFTRGQITLKNQLLKDALVEFELYTSDERAFVYVDFRQQENDEGETLYLRTHKSNAPDTLQYTPVYQGRSAWQLYHGKTGTASATLPAGQWNPVKVKFSGDHLSVWVGDMNQPVMDNIALTGNGKEGKLSFSGNIPGKSQAQFSGAFRNIKVTELTESPASDPLSTEDKTFLDQFAVSAVFKGSKTAITQLPESVATHPWTQLPTLVNGRLEFLRHRAIPKDMRPWAVAAKTILYAETAQLCPIQLGFSDNLTLMLNEQLLAFADASYRYDIDRQEGLMHPDQLRVYLPLKAGENQLQAIVSDSFGGWGLSAYIDDCIGVKEVTSLQ